MRHLNSGSKLGKQPDHRRAVLRSLVTNLLQHGRITTTLTRAKAARPVAEKMITLGRHDTLQPRRQSCRRQRKSRYPGAPWLRVQGKRKEGKAQEGRTRRSQLLSAIFQRFVIGAGFSPLLFFLSSYVSIHFPRPFLVVLTLSATSLLFVRRPAHFALFI